MVEAGKYRVGQKVIVDGKECSVTKVGREYGYLGTSAYKFSLTTGYTVTDRGSRSYVYPSKEEYKKSQHRELMWTILRHDVSKNYRPSANFDDTEEGLTELYRLLGIDRATSRRALGPATSGRG